MICFERSGWQGAEVAVVTSTFFATYTLDANLSEANTLQAFVEDFDAWLTSSSRPWSGFAVIRASAVASTNGRVGVRVTCSGDAVSMTPNPTAAAMSGMSTFSGQTDVTSPGATGTFIPSLISFRGWLPWEKSPGVVSASGGFVAGYPGAVLRRPSCDLVLTERDAVAMAAALAIASNPRRADIYQRTLSTWRRVAVGPTRSPRRSGDLYRAGLEVVG